MNGRSNDAPLTEPNDNEKAAKLAGYKYCTISENQPEKFFHNLEDAHREASKFKFTDFPVFVCSLG